MKRKKPLPCVEALEDRTVPSVSAVTPQHLAEVRAFIRSFGGSDYTKMYFREMEKRQAAMFRPRSISQRPPSARNVTLPPRSSNGSNRLVLIPINLPKVKKIVSAKLDEDITKMLDKVFIDLESKPLKNLSAVRSNL